MTKMMTAMTMTLPVSLLTQCKSGNHHRTPNFDRANMYEGTNKQRTNEQADETIGLVILIEG